MQVFTVCYYIQTAFPVHVLLWEYNEARKSQKKPCMALMLDDVQRVRMMNLSAGIYHLAAGPLGWWIRPSMKGASKNRVHIIQNRAHIRRTGCILKEQGPLVSIGAHRAYGCLRLIRPHYCYYYYNITRTRRILQEQGAYCKNRAHIERTGHILYRTGSM